VIGRMKAEIALRDVVKERISDRENAIRTTL
jgi:hypothetical protein